MKRAENKDFYIGEVKFISGETFHGEVSYDEKTNILYIKREDDEIVTHTANTVLYFKFWNDSETRLFYGLPCDANEDGFEETVFLEVLYEKGKLAVLKYFFTEFHEQVASLDNEGQRTTQNIEKVFVLNELTQLKPVVVADENGIFGRKKINQELLKEIFKDRYSEVMLYVEENKLKIKALPDFLKMMEYYSSF